MSNEKYQYGNSKCKIHWDNDGFKEILNCDALGQVCYDAAERIAITAGRHHEPFWGAYHWHSNMKGGRAAAVVVDDSEGHWGDELEASEKALSRAVSECRIS